MARVMLVRQKVAGVARWDAVSHAPALAAARARARAIGVPGRAWGGKGGDAR